MRGRRLPLLAAAVFAALVGGMLLLRPEPARVRAGAAPAALDPAPPPPLDVPGPVGAPEIEPLLAKGSTRFVRRLEVGEDLMRLRREGGADAARLRLALPFLLDADLDPELKVEPERMLDLLTEPRRDLSHLTLARARGDPLGAAMRVRAWTLGDPYPEDELDRVLATLDLIAARIGRAVPDGIDVLVTPKMGSDVFPFQPQFPGAIGVHFRGDDYCAVRADLDADLRAEVVEHELVHAYCHRTVPSFTSSRLVSEGLAEYLRYLEPGDEGLRVPPARFRDSCVELLGILARLERRGVKTRGISPARLLALPPAGFYALGHLAYLVAQLTMASVGGETIEQAFAEGSDRALRQVIVRLRWQDFLAFVTTHAEGGRIGRAVIVDDADATDPDPPRVAFSKALRAAGADVPRDEKALDPAAARASRIPERLAEAALLDRCLSAAPPNWIATFSPGMDRMARFAALPEGVEPLLGAMPACATPREFAAWLMRRLDPDWPTAASRKTAGHLLRKEPAERTMLILVGNSELSEIEAFVKQRSPQGVLVVDLGESPVREQIARLLESPDRVTAYWRPVMD